MNNNTQARSGLDSIATVVLCVVCTLFLQNSVAAEQDKGGEFKVNSARTYLVEDVYHMDANITYIFSEAVLEALESGVPITVELEIQIYRPREWIWNDIAASLNQRYRIEFHALTQQYLLTNINSQTQTNYPTQLYAVNALGSISDLPLLDNNLLDRDKDYYVRLRASLVINELPSLMRPWAYLNSNWRLSSEWYAWPLE